MSVTYTLDCAEALEWIGRQEEESFQLLYIDPPFNTGRDFGEYDDRWDSPEEYSEWLAERIEHSRPLLADTGSMVVHVDWRMAPRVRLEMERIFGFDNIRNEIVWAYNSGGAGKRHLSRKHDTLIWATKTDDYKFNVHREPYATTGIDDRPGFHPDGRMLTDVWNIPFISTRSRERCGYPTQKPLKLLSRVVALWSDPDDWVGDFFAGSGTTGVAARHLSRRVRLNDQSEAAFKIMQQRLEGL